MTTDDASSLLMTPKEVAAYLRVSRQYVYELCSAGELESVALRGSSRARRIFRSSVDEWAENQPKKPSAA